MINYEFGTREHRGTLQASLGTSKRISKEDFNVLLPLYTFYDFDVRCNQLVFILRNIEKNHRRYPVWLFIKIEEQR